MKAKIMKHVLERLYKIARAKTPNPEELFEKWIKKKRKSSTGDSWYNSFYEKWEKAGQSDDTSDHENKSQETSSQDTGFNNNFGVPQQVVDDLANFDLKPPSSLDEVKKARNREIKKYHSDKFMNDPEKLETSKHIMQIYNAAYARLKTYYEEKS